MRQACLWLHKAAFSATRVINVTQTTCLPLSACVVTSDYYSTFTSPPL